MFKLFLLTLFITPLSFYSLTVNDADGNGINLGNLQGKKVLIVNIAMQSPLVNQLANLEQLHQQYPDSLAIIVVPSNSFYNEPDSSQNIKNIITAAYGTDFIIASKQDIAGDSISSLYRWLTQIEQNGMIQGDVKGDFQKYLINENGTLVGIFMPEVDPLSDEIANAIHQQYN